MKPEPDRFLEIAGVHLMLKTAPALGAGYEQSSALVLGVMLGAVREEHERAVARRVEENATLRALFGEAVPVVTDDALRTSLQRACESADPSLLASDLESENVRLRLLLIDLHAHVEELDSPGARHVEDSIWRELAASTERRRLSLGAF